MSSKGKERKYPNLIVHLDVRIWFGLPTMSKGRRYCTVLTAEATLESHDVYSAIAGTRGKRTQNANILLSL